jgi:hypothetical protein
VIETDFSLDHSFEHLTYRYTDGTSKTAEELHQKYVPIGNHLDDWIGDELVLCPVLLMGYPRIPFASEPVLTASVGHVNAIVDRYIGPHPFFVVSSTPRAGFSGGPAITSYGALLGVVTGSFVHNDKELELGFNGVLTVEPLLNLLVDNGLKPQGIDEEFWNLFKGE